MERKEYNGWTNYETWNCKLWMDNDEGSYGYWGEQAREAINANPDDRADAIDALAGVLEEHFNNDADELNAPGFLGDILTMALREVNWDEIASSLIEDNIEEGDYQDANDEA